MTIANNKRIHIVLVILAIATLLGTVAIAASNHQKLQDLINWPLAQHYFNNGVLSELLGDYTEAINNYQQALEFEYNFEEASEKLKKACKQSNSNYKTMKSPVMNDSEAEAVAKVENSMNRRDYYTADYYNKIGNIMYFDQKHYMDAKTNYDCALGLNPKNAYYYYQRGCANFKLKNTARAIKDVRAGIELSKEERDTASYNQGQQLLQEFQP